MKEVTRSPIRRAVCLALMIVSAAGMAIAAPKVSIDSYWNVEPKTYPAGKLFVTPKAWASGQYVITGNVIRGKKDSISRMLIVREENGGWVIETSAIDKSGKETVTQMLMLGYNEALKTGDFSGISIGWMKMRDEKGNTQKYEGDQMALFNAFMKSTYEKMLVNVPNATDGGAITVTAGTFEGTSYYRSSTKIMGFKVEADSWFNAAVPINGLVKTVSSDGKTVSEVLSFGTDGKPILE